MDLKILLLIPLLTFSACANLEKGLGFSDVQKIVSERTENDIYWNQGTEEDKKVEEKINLLLKKELSAGDAVQVALLNNPNIQALYEDLNIAQAELVGAGLLSNPVFDLESRFHKGGGVGLEVGIVQNFIDILYIPLRKKLAKASFEKVKLSVAGEIIDLTREVRSSFYRYQALEQQLALEKKIVSATDASYSIAKKLRTAGNITELSLSREKAFFEEAKISQRTIEVDVLKARERLNTLIGLWGKNIDWKAEKKLQDPPKNEVEIHGLLKTALQNSIELGVSRQEIEGLGTSLDLSIPFGIFPESEIGISGERESESGEWGFGPSFVIPLPIFNQGQPLKAAAKARLIKAIENYKATAIALRSQLRTSYASLLADKEKALYYKKIILPLNEKLVSESLLQYNAMQIGAFELLDSKREEISAARNYIDSLNNYWSSRTDLETILAGRMVTFDLSEANSSLNNEDSPSSKGH